MHAYWKFSSRPFDNEPPNGVFGSRTSACIVSPGSLDVALSNATPGQAATLFVSVGRGNIPIGPCKVLIQLPQVTMIFGKTSATGTYSTGALPIPKGLKITLTMQALVLDAKTAFGGSLSNGLELVVQ